ncbi:unnamed protein product [Clonostachys byssicola]|uniref:Uncharacterized protein n=1 Tax=Clonostachys byssicola TaxID=160290 RepID=A0A9N9XZS8_9HYPO|nr:unnamed protein product [Clonostachys byssicola]
MSLNGYLFTTIGAKVTDMAFPLGSVGCYYASNGRKEEPGRGNTERICFQLVADRTGSPQNLPDLLTDEVV